MRNFNVSRPKLSAFDKQKDDMDAYPERYERFATSQEWDDGDYEKQKTALLQRYEFTENGFRLIFRENQLEVGETVF